LNSNLVEALGRKKYRAPLDGSTGKGRTQEYSGTPSLLRAKVAKGGSKRSGQKTLGDALQPVFLKKIGKNPACGGKMEKKGDGTHVKHFPGRNQSKPGRKKRWKDITRKRSQNSKKATERYKKL